MLSPENPEPWSLTLGGPVLPLVCDFISLAWPSCLRTFRGIWFWYEYIEFFGMQIWRIFVRYHQNIRGIMTNEECEKFWYLTYFPVGFIYATSLAYFQLIQLNMRISRKPACDTDKSEAYHLLLDKFNRKTLDRFTPYCLLPLTGKKTSRLNCISSETTQFIKLSYIMYSLLGFH